MNQQEKTEFARSVARLIPPLCLTDAGWFYARPVTADDPPAPNNTGAFVLEQVTEAEAETIQAEHGNIRTMTAAALVQLATADLHDEDYIEVAAIARYAQTVEYELSLNQVNAERLARAAMRFGQAIERRNILLIEALTHAGRAMTHGQKQGPIKLKTVVKAQNRRRIIEMADAHPPGAAGYGTTYYEKIAKLLTDKHGPVRIVKGREVAWSAQNVGRVLSRHRKEIL